jgi:hypothetical protein
MGYEHAAYRVVADGTIFLIDCPSAFDRSLLQIDSIVFTHHHFLGAGNQYRELYPARAAIHEADSRHDLCRVSRLMISSWAVFVTAGSRHYISVATHRALPAFF